MLKPKMNTQIFLAMALGVVAGFVFKGQAEHFALVGKVFLNLLKMLVIPMIITSILMSVVSLGDLKTMGKMGARAGIYFFGFTWIATIIGVGLASLIHAGNSLSFHVSPAVTPSHEKVVSLTSLFSDIVPDNIVSAMVTNNILQLIFFALFFGAAVVALGKKGEVIVQFFDSVNEAILKMVNWVIRLAPIGVFALMAALVSRTGVDAFKSLAIYMSIVITGLLLYSFIVLPISLILIGRYSPVTVFQAMTPALAMAFSTASSIATLPVTMDSLKRRLILPNRVVNFVAPLGTAVHSGTALYQAVATVFIAQIYSVHLSVTQLAIVSITATLASLAAAGIPAAGLVTIAIALNTAGVPLEGIGLILGVDRILDMFRTTVNVLTDGVTTVLVARHEGETL